MDRNWISKIVYNFILKIKTPTLFGFEEVFFDKFHMYSLKLINTFEKLLKSTT